MFGEIESCPPVNSSVKRWASGRSKRDEKIKGGSTVGCSGRFPFCKGDCDLRQWRDGREDAIIPLDLQAGTKEQDDLHSCSRNGSRKKIRPG